MIAVAGSGALTAGSSTFSERGAASSSFVAASVGAKSFFAFWNKFPTRADKRRLNFSFFAASSDLTASSVFGASVATADSSAFGASSVAATGVSSTFAGAASSTAAGAASSVLAAATSCE